MVGGILGSVSGSSSIYDCYSSGVVSGLYSIGGILGMGFGSESLINNLERCYSSSAVSGEYATGGIVGEVYLQDGNTYKASNCAANNESITYRSGTSPETYANRILGYFQENPIIDNNYYNKNIVETNLPVADNNVNGKVAKKQRIVY